MRALIDQVRQVRLVAGDRILPLLDVVAELVGAAKHCILIVANEPEHFGCDVSDGRDGDEIRHLDLVCQCGEVRLR